MNYNAALVLVLALVLYSLAFIWRQLFPVPRDDNALDITPLPKSVAIGVLLYVASALVPAADNPGTPMAEGDTARHLLQALTAYVLPWVVIAVVLVGGFPVLFEAFRRILTSPGRNSADD